VGTVTKAAASIVKTLVFWFNKLSQLGVLKDARAVLSLLWESRTLVENLWIKYPKAGKVVEALAQASRASAQAAKTALKWLTFVDRMTDEAAVRFVTFFEKKTAEVGERWLAKWTALRNGNRAVKDAFEAYEKTGEVGEGVHHVLVVAADLDHPVPGRNHARDFAEKYKTSPGGDAVEASSARLKTGLDDARYSDEIIARSIRVHARDVDIPLSPEAVEGTTRFLRDAGGSLDEVEEAAGALARLSRQDADDTFRFLQHPDTPPEVHEGVLAMAKDGLSSCPVVIR
jgi:hypothetical protein